MEGLSALWLPIVLASVSVFLVSSLVHMVLPTHKRDFSALPSEDKVLSALREHGVGPGAYMFPYCTSMKDMESSAFKAKVEQGPVGTLMVRGPGGTAMGKALVQWFVFTLLVSFAVGHIAWSVLPRGADGEQVFHLAALTSLLAYAFTGVVDSIWKGVAWSTSLKYVFDGLLYALATGGVFAWWWPAAV